MRSNKKFRTKRTKRTKKTRINRRTKRLKKTQINRRIKKTKRKKTKRIKKTKKTKKTIQSGGSQKSVWTMTIQEVDEQIPIIENMIDIADKKRRELAESKATGAEAEHDKAVADADASLLYTHRALLSHRRNQLRDGGDGGAPTAGAAAKAKAKAKAPKAEGAEGEG